MRWSWQRKEKRIADPWVIGGVNKYGRPTNAAIQIAALHRCVAVISESIATLPIHIYQMTKDGRGPKPNHPLQSLLYSTPNRLTGKRSVGAREIGNATRTADRSG